MMPGGLGPLRARSHTSQSILIVCSCATMSGMISLDVLLLITISSFNLASYSFVIRVFVSERKAENENDSVGEEKLMV